MTGLLRFFYGKKLFEGGTGRSGYYHKLLQRLSHPGHIIDSRFVSPHLHDLYDLYDLYDLAHVYLGWEPYSLYDML